MQAGQSQEEVPQQLQQQTSCHKYKTKRDRHADAITDKTGPSELGMSDPKMDQLTLIGLRLKEEKKKKNKWRRKKFGWYPMGLTNTDPSLRRRDS